jgi:surfeit locus 1 family protein
MKRGWVVLVAALALALLTARLGWWQLDRAAQKLAMQATLDQRAALPPLLAADWPGTADAAPAHEYRRTQTSGVWLNEFSIYLDNRPINGRTGFYLVTPLRLDDGTALLVQRGWLPRDAAERTHVLAPPAVAGVANVSGRIAPALSRLYEFDGAASGVIRQNLRIEAYALESRLKLKPWVLVQEDSADRQPNDGLVRQWPAPNNGVHKHYGYAFQWFSLSLLTVGLYVWFQLIQPRRRTAALKAHA